MKRLETSFALLREKGALLRGYLILIRALGGIEQYGLTTPIAISKIVETNSFHDALWAFRAVHPDQRKECETIARQLSCDCADIIIPQYEAMNGNGTDRVLGQTIDAARALASGYISTQELIMMRPKDWYRSLYNFCGDSWIVECSLLCVGEWPPKDALNLASECVLGWTNFSEDMSDGGTAKILREQLLAYLGP